MDHYFLFDSEMPGKTTDYAGAEQGLNLLLNVQSEEYIAATRTVGFKVRVYLKKGSIHSSKKETPHLFICKF